MAVNFAEIRFISGCRIVLWFKNIIWWSTRVGVYEYQRWLMPQTWFLHA
jgi:hypothetical protein